MVSIVVKLAPPHPHPSPPRRRGGNKAKKRGLNNCKNMHSKTDSIRNDKALKDKKEKGGGYEIVINCLSRSPAPLYIVP